MITPPNVIPHLIAWARQQELEHRGLSTAQITAPDGFTLDEVFKIFANCAGVAHRAFQEGPVTVEDPPAPKVPR
jgi:hypothetical protein